jgi:hypothetical protein
MRAQPEQLWSNCPPCGRACRSSSVWIGETDDGSMATEEELGTPLEVLINPQEYDKLNSFSDILIKLFNQLSLSLSPVSCL